MKKRYVAAITVLVMFLLMAVLLWFLVGSGISLSMGRCLVADNGSVMLVKGNEPIVLSGNVPGDLQTGDEIFVIHDGIAESYPAQTRATLVIRLNTGSMADIPQNVVDTLTELGWLS